jgi:hypothetical protein
MLGPGVAACSTRADGPQTPLAPSQSSAEPAAAKPGSTTTATGANLKADSAFVPVDPLLVSTCPGNLYSDGSVTWPRFTECVVIQPAGSTYALTNDPYIQLTKKAGLITHVTLHIDDVVGAEGVQHETDPIPVIPAVALGGAGFVLHVHGDRVPVYRLSGHIGGKRVAMIGTISIADIVYF